MSLHYLKATSGPDGLIHLDVPAPEGEYDVTVSLMVKAGCRGNGDSSLDTRSRTTSTSSNYADLSEPVFASAEERGWPPGYIERVMGSIDDETFIRHPQGEYPVRETFE